MVKIDYKEGIFTNKRFGSRQRLKLPTIDPVSLDFGSIINYFEIEVSLFLIQDPNSYQN